MSLEKAEGILIKSNSCSHILETVYLNLGHTYRKKGYVLLSLEM